MIPLFFTDPTDLDCYRAERRTLPLLPEARLLAYIVEAAIEDLRCDARGEAGERIRTDAERYFTARRVDWPFSFERFCEIFHLERTVIEAEILAQRGKGRR